MSKPRQMKCTKYCALYPCDRKSCSRSILINYRNDTITMEEPEITRPITTKMRKGIWSENRATFINDIH